MVCAELSMSAKFQTKQICIVVYPFFFQNCLQAKGAVRLFKLGGEETALVVIYFDDLVNHITQHCPTKPVINRFLKDVIPKVQDVSIDKALLKGDMGFTQQDIR
jgi:hypothetical protein